MVLQMVAVELDHVTNPVAPLKDKKRHRHEGEVRDRECEIQHHPNEL